MSVIEIVPITQGHIEGFHKTLDVVARERRYLSFLEAPPFESTRAFILDMIEQGYPDFVALSWIGFLAAGGTPKPVIDRLNREIVRILNLPDIQERLSGLGATVSGAGPVEFLTFLQVEIRKWDAVAKRANIRLE